MLYRALADIVVVLHLAFIIFVVGGAFLALRWPRLVWVHLPIAIWGASLEFGGWICPLTPLENRLRDLGDQAGYAGGFIEHYLLPVIYPVGLTRGVQVALGIVVIAVNVAAYVLFWRLRKKRR